MSSSAEHEGDFAGWFERQLRHLGERTPDRIAREHVPATFMQAAVLLPFWRAGSRVQTVLTLRPQHMPSHKGQVSFPGGRRQPEDRALVYTALREAHEEVGIAPEQVDVVARLDDTWSPGRFVVSPFVGWLAEPPELVPCPREIERLIIADVERLMDPTFYTRKELTNGQWRYEIDYFDYEGDTIWGMTGGVLRRLFELVRGIADTPNPRSLESLRRYLESLER